MTPPDDALFIALLTAGGFGNEHHLRWEISLVRANYYYLSARVLAGVKMRWVDQSADPEARRIQRRMQAFRERRRR